MQFGDYIRDRRTERGWTQPQAAAQAGIEQSYLSKLETGKSIPSEDVFQRLVQAYTLDIEAMVNALEPAERARLREIKSIATHLSVRQHDVRSVARHWLIAGLVLLVLGGSLMGLSQLDRGGPMNRYTYQSDGVILPGESVDVFAEVDEHVSQSTPGYAERAAARDALYARMDDQTIFTAEMRGPVFTENVPQGRRLWRLVGANTVRVPPKFGWALVPGFALILGGLGCFFISWRRP